MGVRVRGNGKKIRKMTINAGKSEYLAENYMLEFQKACHVGWSICQQRKAEGLKTTKGFLADNK